MTVKVVVVDDHAMFRRGVTAELEAAGRDVVEIVGEGEDVDTAVAAIVATGPDVVLLDVHLPGGGGVEVMRKLATQLPGDPPRFRRGPHGSRRSRSLSLGRAKRGPEGSAGMTVFVERAYSL